MNPKTSIQSLTLLLIACCMCISALAQEKGKIHLRIVPYDAVVRIDTQKVILSKKYDDVFEAEVGTYRLRAWYPKMNLLDTTFTIHADSLSKFYKFLGFSDEYKQYKKDLKRYHRNRSRAFFSPIPIAFSIAGYIHLRKKLTAEIQPLFDDSWAERYEAAIGVIDFEDLELRKSEIKKGRRLVAARVGLDILGNSLSAFLAYLSYKSFQKRTRFVKPAFDETPLLSRLEFDYNYCVSSGNSISLTLNF